MQDASKVKYVKFVDVNDNAVFQRCKLAESSQGTPRSRAAHTLVSALGVPTSLVHKVSVYNSPGCSLKLPHTSVLGDPVDSDVEVEDDGKRASIVVYYDKQAADAADTAKLQAIRCTPASRRAGVGKSKPAAPATTPLPAKDSTTAGTSVKTPGTHDTADAAGETLSDDAAADDDNAEELEESAGRRKKVKNPLPSEVDTELKHRIDVTMARSGPAAFYISASREYFWKKAYKALIKQLHREYCQQYPELDTETLETEGRT